LKRLYPARPSHCAESPPARGRGLKQTTDPEYIAASLVAPRAGAWIETSYYSRRLPRSDVAPRAGAWIETP